LPDNLVINDEKAHVIEPGTQPTKATVKESSLDSRSTDRLQQLRRVLLPFTKHPGFDYNESFVCIDVGSGDGVITCAIASVFPKWLVIGVDPFEQRVCHKNDPANVSFVKTYTGLVPNMYTFHMSLHHMEDWRNELDYYIKLSDAGTIIVVREHDAPKARMQVVLDAHPEPKQGIHLFGRNDLIGFMMSRKWYPVMSASYPKNENVIQSIFTVSFAREEHPAAILAKANRPPKKKADGGSPAKGKDAGPASTTDASTTRRASK